MPTCRYMCVYFHLTYISTYVCINLCACKCIVNMFYSTGQHKGMVSWFHTGMAAVKFPLEDGCCAGN